MVFIVLYGDLFSYQDQEKHHLYAGYQAVSIRYHQRISSRISIMIIILLLPRIINGMLVYSFVQYGIQYGLIGGQRRVNLCRRISSVSSINKYLLGIRYVSMHQQQASGIIMVINSCRRGINLYRRYSILYHLVCQCPGYLKRLTGRPITQPGQVLIVDADDCAQWHHAVVHMPPGRALRGDCRLAQVIAHNGFKVDWRPT